MAVDSLPEDFLCNFDVQLQEIYHQVICEEMSLQKMWNVHALNRAMRTVTEAVSRGDSSTCFDSASERNAYIMRHSTCFTSAVATHLLKLINRKKNILSDCLENRRLNICCLGGGPASDVVAVIKVVQGLYHPIWMRTGQKLVIYVTIVDINEGWRETASNVFHTIARSPNFFGANQFLLSFKFITADLTKSMTEEVSDVLKAADIISLIFLLSAVSESKEQERSTFMIQNIMNYMKKGSLLLFLDSAADQHYKLLNKAAERCHSLQAIYGPLVEEFHTISLQSVSKFLELYAKHFNRFFCLTDMFICVSVYRKMKVIPPGIKITKDLFSPPPFWCTSSQQKSEELTNKMAEYRASVRKLVETRYSTMKKSIKTTDPE